ncbi:hypothetical protein FD51_GL002817 [Lacticaseibacillus zeae DSM 20178 = KCTC 3804]|uniref:Uncharacterized protein n=1 Tax=Lacticaseibacillus zeae DSM 20178 = KCTC 3804 TaxID=1423816 RepID=A0A0R1EX01_LACZE|nr:hypothetical protein FD51_GL002817 [Lacticaseibacillus zeae DSM 20178 = KCTC 3804]
MGSFNFGATTKRTSQKNHCINSISQILVKLIQIFKSFLPFSNQITGVRWDKLYTVVFLFLL